MNKNMNWLVLTLAAKYQFPHKPKKNKAKANFLVATILIGLFASAFVCAISGSSQLASAQPLYPVSGASVSASGNDFGSATTDTLGRYNITSYLGAGFYSVTASATGCIDAERDNVSVASGAETVNVNFLLNASGVITGKITDQSTGTPLTISFVSATPATGTGGGTGAITDNNGNYILNTNLPTGTYNITAYNAAGYIGQTVSGIAVTQGSTTSNVNIALPKSGIIVGTIRDSVTSAPQPNVLVEAISQSTGNYVASAITNSSGQYTLNMNLATGTYNITEIFPTNHLPKTVSGVIVTAGQQTTANILLDPSGIITGRITSTTGQPVAGASVYASFGSFFGFATTDGSGNYQITSGLGTGVYSVTALYSTSFNLTAGVNVVQGQTTANVNMQLTLLPSGIITGRLTNSTGSPIQSASVTATDALGLSAGSATTNSSGDYVISTGLNTGSYNVTATATGYAQQVKTGIVVIVNQVTANVNFQLTAVPSGRISGLVQTTTPAIPENPSVEVLAFSAFILTAVTVQTVLTKRKKKP
jgi:hypothetical protein